MDYSLYFSTILIVNNFYSLFHMSNFTIFTLFCIVFSIQVKFLLYFCQELHKLYNNEKKHFSLHSIIRNNNGIRTNAFVDA